MIEVSIDKVNLVIPSLSIIIIIVLILCLFTILNLYLIASFKLRKQTKSKLSNKKKSEVTSSNQKLKLKKRKKSIYKISYSVIVSMIAVAFTKQSQGSEIVYGDKAANFFYLSEVFIVSFLSIYFILLFLEMIVDSYPNNKNKKIL